MHSFRIASFACGVFFIKWTFLLKYPGGVLLIYCCCGPWLRCCGNLPVKRKRSCWYVTDKQVYVASYSLDMLLADDCSLIISSSVLFVFFRHTSTFQLLDIQAVVTCVVPFPPFRFLPSLLLAHRVHVSRFLQVSWCQRNRPTIFFSSTHSGGFEVAKLTYTRLEDNLIRHRGKD